ncbi:MAG: hypothetical protein RLZ35_190 [Pseudomonadota bacterium]|jgi:competence protein ComEC
MIIPLLAFLLGNTSIYFLPAWPNSATVIGTVFLIFILTGLLIVYHRRKVGARFKIPLIACLCFTIGHIWVLNAAYDVHKQAIPNHLVGKPLIVEGQIVGIPVVTDRYAQFEFQVYQLPDQPKAWPYPGKVSLIWYWKNRQANDSDQLPILMPGDRHILSVSLKKPRGLSNPGSFDTEKQFFIRHIVAEGKVIKWHPDVLSKKAWHLKDSIDRYRVILKQKLEVLSQSYPYQGILEALTIGIKDKISHDEWALFQKTGTAHLMSISGLHIGLIAGFCFYLGFFVWARGAPAIWLHRIPAPMIGAYSSIAGAFVYALLSGFSVPTQRAFVMVCCAMVGILMRRNISSWRLYGIALLVVLLIDPLATLSIGFWLSFGAVAVILYGMQNRLKPSGLWWKYGRIQWIVFIGLFPLSAYGFQGVSLISPLANMLAIPWVSFVTVPFALLGVLMSPIQDSIAHICLHIASLSLSGLLSVLSIMSNSPIHFWTFPVIESMIPLVCGLVGIVILLLPKGIPGRWLGLLWLLPLLIVKSASPEMGHARVTILDVGQGLATVVSTKNHLLIFDTGAPLGKNSDMGARVILPYLSTIHFGKPIDRIIVSHVDSDHAGGLVSLLKSSHVKHIMTSEPQVLKERLAHRHELDSIHLPPIDVCHTHQAWDWDGVHFEILHPVDPSVISKRNNRSCVLSVSVGKQRILMTGDIEASVERRLIRSAVRHKLPASVMVVPHHGSKTSSDMGFIRQVNPAYAVVSTGYMNRYGHPKAAIMERYKHLGIKWLDTTTSGAVTFYLEPDRLHVQQPDEYRARHRKIWLSNFY